MVHMVDWGSIPAYFGGLALFFSAWTLRRERTEKIRSQANQIAAWVQRSRDGIDPNRIVIRNASNLPCTDIMLRYTQGYVKKPNKLSILSKTFGADTNHKMKPIYVHAVGPSETLVVRETHEDIAVRGLWFTDASTREWARIGAKLHYDPYRKRSARRRFAARWKSLWGPSRDFERE
jgi:hypothetical protein